MASLCIHAGFEAVSNILNVAEHFYGIVWACQGPDFKIRERGPSLLLVSVELVILVPVVRPHLATYNTIV